jgi:hypothetical protein
MLTTGMRLSHARVEGEGLRRNLTRRPINGMTGGCVAVPLERSLQDGRPLFFPLDGLKGTKSSVFYLRVTPAVGRNPSMVILWLWSCAASLSLSRRTEDSL